MQLVRVQPDGITYILDRAVVGATELRATWAIAPKRGSYFLCVSVGCLPSAGTLSSVRTVTKARLSASANLDTDIELDYSVPDTGACSIASGPIATYFDGAQYLRVTANTSTGSIDVQGTVLLIPAGETTNNVGAGRVS